MKDYRFTQYQIKLVKEKRKTYAPVKVKGPDCLKSICFDILKLHEKSEEHFCLITLDGGSQVTGVMVCSIGILNAAHVHPREVFKRALLNNAASVIFIHNHPSGGLEPSQADVNVTEKLIEGGKLLSINVYDHIIVNPQKGLRSMRDCDMCTFS